jgi:transcriptional regulator with XRE-family HTH domain
MTNVASPVDKPATIKQESRVYFAALGRRITQLRKSRGYTQGEFAQKLGVSQQSVFAYETGERRISVLMLERIAKLYALSTDQVIGLEPERATPKRRLSPKAMRHAERIQNLSKAEQRFIVRIIDHLEEMRHARKPPSG